LTAKPARPVKAPEPQEIEKRRQPLRLEPKRRRPVQGLEPQEPWRLGTKRCRRGAVWREQQHVMVEPARPGKALEPQEIEKRREPRRLEAKRRRPVQGLELPEAREPQESPQMGAKRRRPA
jgi:hypothetical protein